MKERYRVSLDIAKKLKVAGFPQDECECYWIEIDNVWKLYGDIETGDDCIAAPCVGRLGEELPKKNNSLWSVLRNI